MLTSGLVWPSTPEPTIGRSSTHLLVLVAFGASVGAPARAHDGDGLASLKEISDAMADLAERVAPTTVYLQSDKGSGITSGLQQLMRDYALPQLQEGGPTFGTSSGSGVLVDADGLVLTNHHVVTGAQDLVVTLHDQRRFPAEVVGSDPRTDIAVVQILGEGPFPTAVVGDSDTLRVGEWVMAVGHPFDFQFTVTTGIVSARGRRNLVEQEIQDFIQTDAAVNPGSSGGPLFDLDGELVGINTAIYSPAGGPVASAGISFAIPSNMAQRISQELMATGRVAQAGIGVSTRDVAPTADDLRPGAEVTRLVPEGPAETAGLRRGDIIETVNGETVHGSRDLRAIVLARGPDESLKLRIRRGQRRLQLALRTVDDRTLGSADVALPYDAFEWAGLTLTEALPARLAEQGIVLPDDREGGLLVISAAPDGPGGQAGLAAGDVLLEVQHTPISDAKAFLEVVDGRRSAMVYFWRGEGEGIAAVAGLPD